MNDSTHTDRQPAANQATNSSNPPTSSGVPGGLAPYSAPAIIFRTPLEAVAASCYSAPGKADLFSCLVGNS